MQLATGSKALFRGNRASHSTFISLGTSFRWVIFVDADGLDRVLGLLLEHGGNPDRLEYLRDPKLQPLALLQLSADFLIEFIEANIRGNDPFSAKDLETITFYDFVLILGNTWGCMSSFHYVE